jgi:hypothetical protein
MSPLHTLLALFTIVVLMSAANACCLPNRFVVNFMAELEGKKNGVDINYNISGR